ncbi:MAG TPA: type II toxin-antitoxin system PemK/MazF family toxin [Streptosporangiaceae bacterium]|nr:type II toxin-antitoxin system PemK/MazF family toxin [Streptosporangiaceae bacterium]
MSRSFAPLRGQVFHVDVEGAGPHYWLVVSNNTRNAHLDDVLSVMLTTTPPRSVRASYVPLTKGQDPFDGWVKCDDIGRLYRDELGRVKGALSPGTMRRVDAGLAFALSLPRPA